MFHDMHLGTCLPAFLPPQDTYGFEGGDLGSIVGASVVDRHPAGLAVQEAVRDLAHALVRPVARLEVHVGRPVVGQVLAEGAGSAVGQLRDVGLGDQRLKGILIVSRCIDVSLWTGLSGQSNSKEETYAADYL